MAIFELFLALNCQAVIKFAAVITLLSCGPDIDILARQTGDNCCG